MAKRRVLITFQFFLHGKICFLEKITATPQFGLKIHHFFCGALLGIYTGFGNSQALNSQKNNFRKANKLNFVLQSIFCQQNLTESTWSHSVWTMPESAKYSKSLNERLFYIIWLTVLITWLKLSFGALATKDLVLCTPALDSFKLFNITQYKLKPAVTFSNILKSFNVHFIVHTWAFVMHY